MKKCKNCDCTPTQKPVNDFPVRMSPDTNGINQVTAFWQGAAIIGLLVAICFIGIV